MQVQGSQTIKEPPSELDTIEVVTVVDSYRVLTQDQCFLVQDAGKGKPSITQLSQNTKLVFTPDRLVSKHQHVKALASVIADEFLTRGKSHRILLNVVDSLNSNNIGGFNISNFKMRYLNEFISDVISDYDQSFLGSVVRDIATKLGISSSTSEAGKYDLYMSITKFKGDVGFSLLQGDSENLILRQDDEEPIKEPASPE